MALEGVTLPLVLGTAIVDSINPCAIGVLLLLLSVLIKQGKKDKSRMLKIAGVYIFVTFLVYVLSGLGLVWFQATLIKAGLAVILGTIIGALVVIGGIIEIKDYFWYGKGISLSIPAKYTNTIKKRAENVTVGGAVILGAFVAIVELPCTGGPYLAITSLLAHNFNFLALIYLLIYNFIFVLPLIIITLLAYFGTSMQKMQEWKQDGRKWMRLATGIVMVLLGLFLIYYYQTGHLLPV